MLIIFVGLGASRNPTRWLLQKSVNPGMKDADNSYDNPAGNCQSSCRRTPDPAITIVLVGCISEASYQWKVTNCRFIGRSQITVLIKSVA